jgi:hypothetical protein
MAINASFTELSTTTLNLWGSKDFADAFSGHNPLWFRLREQGNIQTGGLGPQILEPLMYPSLAAPTPAGVSSGYTQITPTPTEGWGPATYSWAEKIMDVSVETLTLDYQGSETRKISYLDALKERSMIAFMEGLNSDLWRAPSGVGVGGNTRQYLGSVRAYFNRGGGSTPATTPAPLTEQVGAAVDSSITTVGGIDRSTLEGAYFCTPINSTSTATPDLGDWQAMVSLATRNNDVPDLAITTRAEYNRLAETLMNLQRYKPGSLSDAGFRNTLNFDGMDVYFDDNCPANNAFFINSKYLKLRCDTMKPKFTYRHDPDRVIERWLMRLVCQLTSGHLGRVHSRATAWG